MSGPSASGTLRATSPDPASHTRNLHDDPSGEGEWLDEEDDDDMDIELATDESEDNEFFDPSEEVESDFHGIAYSSVALCTLDPLHQAKLADRYDQPY